VKFSARRRTADLAAARAHAAAAAYRESAEGLQSRWRRDWKLPLAFGAGAGVVAGVLPIAATMRVAGFLLRAAVSLSRVPRGALARIARNASHAGDSASD